MCSHEQSPQQLHSQLQQLRWLNPRQQKPITMRKLEKLYNVKTTEALCFNNTFKVTPANCPHFISVSELIIAPSGDDMVECIWKWSSRSSSRFLECISICTCHSDLMGGEAWKPALSFPQPQGQNGVVIFSVMEGETVGGSGGGATTQRDGNSEPNRSFPLWLPLEQRVC